ncbi:MAG TPA: alpha/beta hydrolase-fold protein [Cyclobacteriaceae bacterium]|nr:alpha/beta hydrolase-fold protein [Cyclobacteriaceae bacterium]
MKKYLVGIFCVALSLNTIAQTSNEYTFGPDSQRQPNVPKGTVTTSVWESNIIKGTKRNYSVYVPAQYDASKPAALMVFQDGHAYLKEDGDFRTTIVYDNLIHKKELPVTICLFIDPGYWTALGNPPANPFQNHNRSQEYDDVSDRYVTFLINEVIADLKTKYNISADPKMHGIAGLSSGAICAFTAAWFRPDYFHKVLSHIGSYTDIRGGHQYPTLIRKSSKKDIKIFLQDGNRDLNNEYGDWWLANLQMESSLKYRGYDYKFVSGTGEHNGKHGGAILPESLKWLWSDVVTR